MGKQTSNKKSKKLKYEVVCGANSLIELLKSGRRKLFALYTTKPYPKAYSRIEKHLPKRIPNIQYVSKDVLTKMAGTQDHMGIVALVSEYKFKKNMFDPATQPFLLLLDSVQDIRNLGAILRSAYCTGVDGVVLVRKGGAPLNPVSHKASAGLVEHLNIYVASSIQSGVAELKKAGYNLYMAVLDPKAKDATKVKYEYPACLVIGNEAVGISKSVQRYGDLITLPQKSFDISYNASVATGILLFLLSDRLPKIKK